MKTLRSALVLALAMAVAVAFSPDLRAGTFASPDSRVTSDTVMQVAAKKKAKKSAKKGKKAAKKSKKKGKKAKSKAGKCGTFKYYNKKTRKCVDARNKK